MNPGEIDETVLTWVVDHRTPWATSVANAVMDLGTTPRWLAAIAFVALVVVAALRAWWVALAVVGSVVVASVVVGLLKHAIGRARPPADLALVHLSGYSMPSSEAARTAAASTALVVTVVWSSRRLMFVCGALLSLATLFVGVCMVYLGGHWVSDLLLGWTLGIVIGLAVGVAVRRVARRAPVGVSVVPVT